MLKKFFSLILVFTFLSLQLIIASGASSASANSNNSKSLAKKVLKETNKAVGNWILSTVSTAKALASITKTGVSTQITSVGTSEDDIQVVNKNPYNLKSGKYNLTLSINSSMARKACVEIEKSDKTIEKLIATEVSLKKGANTLTIPFSLKEDVAVFLSLRLGYFKINGNIKSHVVAFGAANFIRSGDYVDPNKAKEEPDRFKNRVVNGDFSDTEKPDNGWWTNGNVALAVENGIGILTIPGGSGNPWDEMTGNAINYSLHKNRTYLATFEISSELDQYIVFQIVDSEEAQILAKTIKISKTMKKYSVEFDVTNECLAKTAFQMGGIGTKGENFKICLDNVQVVEVENPTNANDDKIDPFANMVRNPKFASDTRNWNCSPMEGGDGTFSVDKEEAVVNITNTGTKEYSIQFFQDGLKLYKGNKYKLSFRYKSNTNRSAEVRIQQNGGTYTGYLSDKTLALTTSWQTYEKEFTMEYADDTAARLCFNLGVISSPTKVDQNIYFDDFNFVMTKGTIPIKEKDSLIHLNQVGYRPDDEKIAFVTSEERTFKLYSIDNKLIMTGNLPINTIDTKGMPVVDTQSGDIVRRADFSSLKLDGKYFIKVRADKSPVFEIGKTVYEDMTKAALKLFYYQTCGNEGILEKYVGSTFAHAPCHIETARFYDSTDKIYGKVNIDVSGGWHDAGDYGRYVTPASKAVADLLMTAEHFPAIAKLNYGSPNKLFAEVKAEIQWMLKMQNNITGGVYHKVTTQNHAAMTVIPEADNNQLFLSPVSAQATADFAAVMAYANRMYKNSDSKFAKSCLIASEKAWKWLEANPNMNSYIDPFFFTTGTYNDTSSQDERFWAATELYISTQNSKYMTYVINNNQSYTGFGWSNMGYYAMVSYLNYTDTKKKDILYETMKQNFIKNADYFVSIWKNDGYKVVLDEYVWGSNKDLSDRTMVLIIANEIAPNPIYKKVIMDQLNYLLGRNANGISYVTGFGDKSVKHPHHRQSIIKNLAVSGMLVGGPNSTIMKVVGDPVAKMVNAETPAAKCYADVDGSFATNEICIYWNSPLVYILGYLYGK